MDLIEKISELDEKLAQSERTALYRLNLLREFLRLQSHTAPDHEQRAAFRNLVERHIKESEATPLAEEFKELPQNRQNCSTTAILTVMTGTRLCSDDAVNYAVLKHVAGFEGGPDSEGFEEACHLLKHSVFRQVPEINGAVLDAMEAFIEEYADKPLERFKRAPELLKKIGLEANYPLFPANRRDREATQLCDEFGEGEANFYSFFKFMEKHLGVKLSPLDMPINGERAAKSEKFRKAYGG